MLKKILSLGCLSFGIIGFSSPSFKQAIMAHASSDFIEISSFEELKQIADNPDGNYRIVNNIDCEHQSFAFGNFSGKLDGSGFKIFDFGPTNELNYLFSSNEGSIENVHLAGAGLSDSNLGTIINCFSEIDISQTFNSASGTHNLGFVVGTNSGTISNVGLSGEYSVSVVSGNTPTFYVGGVSGSNSGTITNVVSDANIRVSDDDVWNYIRVGGVTGNNTGTINYCSITSDLQIYSLGNYNYLGGIAGFSSTNSITNCFSSGNYVGYGNLNTATHNVAGITNGSSFICASEATISATNDHSKMYAVSSSGSNLLYLNSGLTIDTTSNEITRNCISSDNYLADSSAYSKELYNNSKWNFDILNNNVPQLDILSIVRNNSGINMTISFAAGISTCNGDNYESGSIISSAGIYDFIFTFGGYEFKKTFVNDAIINGIEDGSSYYDSVSLEYIGGSATLDGNSYTSGTEITEIGNHTIVITGENNYSKTLSFAVIPTISGIENDGLYEGSVTPSISGGTLALDGNTYESGTIINEPGVHTLVVTGVNGYSNTINFSISLVDSGISDGDNFVDSATYTFSGGVATLDGNSYTSGTEITEIGNHRIVVTGSNEYTKTIDFVINPSIIGLEDGETYDGSVTPSISGGTLTLDGNAYESGTIINEPGDHVLTISGVNGYSNTINFSISLVEGGIVDGATYYDEATYTFSGGSATLDGNAYESGTKITEIGNHTIVVTGSTDYEKTISFTIVPTIENIEDGQTYDESVTPLISGGTITLDGNAYSSGVKITQPGDHVIVISGSNNYSKTINFSISLIDSGIKDGDSFVETATYTFSGGSATLDGDSYTSGTEITEIGNHTIIVTGSGSFSKTIQFVIEPYIEGLLDGETYDGSITPTIRGGTITLDGNPYTSKTTIVDPGDHIILIEGKNGYEKEISFSISLQDDGIVDDGSYEESATYTFSGGSATLDGNAYESGTKITEIGNHTIVVNGSTGYEKTINFAIDPKIENITDGSTYEGSVTPKISGGTLALDGNTYESETVINEPGDHTLVIIGVNDYSRTINFSVSLTDSGISDGDIFVDSATYTFSGGSATLDGDSYTSGTEITEIGNHTIIVTGSGSFSKTIQFVIEPSIVGLEDGKTYEGSVIPEISGGTLTLDNNPYTSGTVINEPGEHLLEITGANGYKKVINFAITFVDNGIVDGSIYYEPVSYTFSGGSATLDGNPYTSGTTISQIGTHTIVVSGSNGFEKTISFEIKAVEYEIESNDSSWSINFIEINPDTIITIDGVTIQGDYTETRIGNHTLVISNANGYSKTISFTIKEQVSFSDGDSFSDPLVIDGINGQVYVDGVEVQNGYRIDQNGKHVITIVGTNGYKSIYTITYNNPNYNYSFVMLVPTSLIVVTSIFVFVLKRRLK